jgi:outer membrane protein OmpA-like peptidoglycan-associated protein
MTKARFLSQSVRRSKRFSARWTNALRKTRGARVGIILGAVALTGAVVIASAPTIGASVAPFKSLTVALVTIARGDASLELAATARSNEPTPVIIIGGAAALNPQLRAAVQSTSDAVGIRTDTGAIRLGSIEHSSGDLLAPLRRPSDATPNTATTTEPLLAVAALPVPKTLSQDEAPKSDNNTSAMMSPNGAAPLSPSSAPLQSNTPPVPGATIASETAANCGIAVQRAARDATIWFAPGGAKATPREMIKAEELAKRLAQCPIVRVEVAGHTDALGLEASNFQLSWQRGENVIAHLKLRGIDTSRFDVVGYGTRRPMVATPTRQPVLTASTDPEAFAREAAEISRRLARNRRVEFNAR